MRGTHENPRPEPPWVLLTDCLPPLSRFKSETWAEASEEMHIPYRATEPLKFTVLPAGFYFACCRRYNSVSRQGLLGETDVGERVAVRRFDGNSQVDDSITQFRKKEAYNSLQTADG